MYDAETGEIVDGPVMNRYEMFFLIRGLRAVIRAHAQTIRDKEAVLGDALKKAAEDEKATAEVQEIVRKYQEDDAYLRSAIGQIAAMAKSLTEPNQ